MLEDRGVPVIVPGYPGWTFKVRQETEWSPHFHRAMARVRVQPDVAAYLERASAAGYAPTDADRDLDRRMLLEVFAEAGIAAWDGVTDIDDKPMPYNTANAVKLMSHFDDIARHLRAASNNAALFKVEVPAKEVLAGN